MELHDEPASDASLRVPRVLGCAEEATLRRRLPANEGEPPRDAVVFALFADTFRSSAAAAVQLEARDALGRRLDL